MAKIWQVKLIKSLVASAAVHSRAVVLMLFIDVPLFVGVVLGPCFVMQYFVSFLVLQSFHTMWLSNRKYWLTYHNIVLSKRKYKVI